MTAVAFRAPGYLPPITHYHWKPSNMIKWLHIMAVLKLVILQPHLLQQFYTVVPDEELSSLFHRSVPLTIVPLAVICTAAKCHRS